MQNISLLPIDAQLRISIGAGNQAWPGWIATQGNELNLLRRDQWETIFGERRIDALLCEHVLEHLTEAEGRAAATLCYDFLKPGGYLRCAVPATPTGLSNPPRSAATTSGTATTPGQRPIPGTLLSIASLLLAPQVSSGGWAGVATGPPSPIVTGDTDMTSCPLHTRHRRPPLMTLQGQDP